MGDPTYANSINETLLKPGTTRKASEYMTADRISRILESFPLMDPYVQAVLLQSVVHISSDEFHAIRPEYSKLIDIASDSRDQWVRRKAAEFRTFPRLTVDDDISEFDFSGVFDDTQSILPTFQRDSPEQRGPVHFSMVRPVKAPSDELPPIPRPMAPRALVPPPERLPPRPIPAPRAMPERDVERNREREKEREREREMKKNKKKVFSIEELQAERNADYRPDTKRRK
jgi:hypothetical protein